MEFSQSEQLAGLHTRLIQLPPLERRKELWEMDDQILWELFRMNCGDALIVLFKKYHRQIILTVYQKLNRNGEVRLAIVQDAFGELLEKILAGSFREEMLKKNFTAFAVYHLSLLVKTRLKRFANSKVDGLEEHHVAQKVTPHVNVEERIDFEKIIDLIPKISNRAYRMVLYLVFVFGYSSADLAEVLGQREKAYDKRSRALKAFRKLLAEEGILHELK